MQGVRPCGVGSGCGGTQPVTGPTRLPREGLLIRTRGGCPSTCCKELMPRPLLRDCLPCPPIVTIWEDVVIGRRGIAVRAGGAFAPRPERRSFSGTPDEVWPSGKCRSEGLGGMDPGPGRSHLFHTPFLFLVLILSVAIWAQAGGLIPSFFVLGGPPGGAMAAFLQVVVLFFR